MTRTPHYVLIVVNRQFIMNGKMIEIVGEWRKNYESFDKKNSSFKSYFD